MARTGLPFLTLESLASVPSHLSPTKAIQFSPPSHCCAILFPSEFVADRGSPKTEVLLHV